MLSSEIKQLDRPRQWLLNISEYRMSAGFTLIFEIIKEESHGYDRFWDKLNKWISSFKFVS